MVPLFTKDEPETGTVTPGTEISLFQRVLERLAVFLNRRRVRLGIQWVLGGFVAAVLVLGAFYIHFAHVIDARLATGAFADTTNIYTAPRTVAVGDPMTLD